MLPACCHSCRSWQDIDPLEDADSHTDVDMDLVSSHGDDGDRLDDCDSFGCLGSGCRRVASKLVVGSWEGTLSREEDYIETY